MDNMWRVMSERHQARMIFWHFLWVGWRERKGNASPEIAVCLHRDATNPDKRTGAWKPSNAQHINAPSTKIRSPICFRQHKPTTQHMTTLAPWGRRSPVKPRVKHTPWYFNQVKQNSDFAIISTLYYNQVKIGHSAQVNARTLKTHLRSDVPGPRGGSAGSRLREHTKFPMIDYGMPQDDAGLGSGARPLPLEDWDPCPRVYGSLLPSTPPPWLSVRLSPQRKVARAQTKVCSFCPRSRGITLLVGMVGFSWYLVLQEWSRSSWSSPPFYTTAVASQL